MPICLPRSIQWLWPASRERCRARRAQVALRARSGGQTELACEGEDAVYFIDQHAADERVKFDRLRKAFRERRVQGQRLLIPERIECLSEEMAVIEEYRNDIAAAGLDCEVMGEATVFIRSVPALLYRAAPQQLLRDLLTQLDRKGERAAVQAAAGLLLKEARQA